MTKTVAAAKKRDHEVRTLVNQLENDPPALRVVVELAELLAKRSPARRR